MSDYTCWNLLRGLRRHFSRVTRNRKRQHPNSHNGNPQIIVIKLLSIIFWGNWTHFTLCFDSVTILILWHIQVQIDLSVETKNQRASWHNPNSAEVKWLMLISKILKTDAKVWDVRSLILISSVIHTVTMILYIVCVFTSMSVTLNIFFYAKRKVCNVEYFCYFEIFYFTTFFTPTKSIGSDEKV